MSLLDRYLSSILRPLGLDRSDLEFVKPLEKRFTCPVCQYVLWVPIQLSCGHYVCYECYNKVFQFNNTATCPVGVDDNCKNININEVKFDRSVCSEVLRLKVKCPYSKYGCSDVMCLSNLEWHLKGWKDVSAPCNYRFGLKTKRKDSENVSQAEKLTTLDSTDSEFNKKILLENRDLKEKVNNLTLRLNTMTDTFSKQLSAHGKQLEDHDVRIAEMETENYDGIFIVKKKKGENRRKQDSINEKSKIYWHKEILKKNYLYIMDNVRVNDIINHLFGSKVINDNDMDIIKTKLKSEGNREALSYLMDILLKSSHTALTTFIQCLNQTRYEYIAKRLQEDIDNSVGGGGR